MSKEFFKSDELRKDQEFKKFKAEEYHPKDINKTASENYQTSEFSNNSSSKPKKEKNIIQKLIQKVTESASSYAGSLAVTATVLVTTVVVMTGLITTAPQIEILELDSNINEVSYNILLEDVDENTEYHVLITNNIVDYQYPLVEGENKNIVKDIPSGYLYTLKVIGKNGNEEVIYLSTNFYTLSPTKETYTIIFMDGDIVLDEKEYEYGEIPTYDKTLTKEKDDKYTYEFIGWDSEIVEVTENHVYHAVWEKILNTYTVSFVVDGKTVQTEELEYGVLPVYKGDTPVKDENYEFIGWDKEISEVTKDTIYTAVFKKITEKYTVSFMIDNNLIQTEELEYGVLPVYKGNTPKKDATKEYSYEFIGWDKEISEVTCDVVYKALFKEIKNKYTITFVVDGEIVQTEELEYGVLPTYKGDTPTKDEEGKIYIFAGWDPEIENVTDDKTYTALFIVEGEKFTISFVVDGKTVQTEELEYGVLPTYKGDTPTKDEEGKIYIFAGWDPEIENVTDDKTYTAVFIVEGEKFTISFVVEGVTTQTEELEYGVLPVYKGSTPEKDATLSATYEFIGWDKEISEVNKDTIYTAVFKEIKNKYTISFVVDGITTQTEELEYGVLPVYKGSEPYKEGTSEFDYEFAGWSPEIKTVTQNQVYEAIFNTVEHSFRGTINDFTSSDVEVEWNDNLNVVYINTGFDNLGDTRISYRLILFNEDYQFEEVYTGSDDVAIINVPSSIPYASMRYEIFGVYLDVEEILESKTIYTPDGGYDEIYFVEPGIGIFSEELINISQDEYMFEYEVISDFPDEESIKNVSIVLDYIYDDGKTSYEAKTLTRRNGNVNETMRETIQLPSDVSSVNVNFTITINGKYGGNPRKITHSETLNVPSYLNINDIFVDNNYGIMHLNGEYSLVGNQVIVIETMNTPTQEISTADALPTEVYLRDGQTYQYYIGAPTPEGAYEVISEPVMITLESDVTGEYNLNYKNPNDILLTYNEDNTYNIYVNGEFSTDDPDIYWMVCLDGMHPGYSTQESVLVIENIPDGTYGIVYYVYKVINDIRYSLYSVSVSGTIGEHNHGLPIYIQSEDNPLSGIIELSLYNYIVFEKENIYAIITDADGKETIIECKPENIVYDEETFQTIINLNVTNGFTSGKLYINMNDTNVNKGNNNSYDVVSQHVNIKGNIYKTYELEIE